MEENIQILVIEDERIVAKDIRLKLENLGYNVANTISSGKKAIEEIKKSRPSLVIMDIMLRDEMDGLEIAKWIREEQDIPVIFLTAYGDDNTIQKAKLIEPFGYILKPFEERELQISIEIALYKHKTEKKLKEKEQLLSTTLKSIQDAIITLNTDKKITFINLAAEKLLNVKSEEVLEKYLTEVINSAGIESSIDRTLSPVEKKIPQVSNETIIYSKNNKTGFISYKSVPIRDKKDTINGVLLIMQDLSEQNFYREVFTSILENTSATVGEEYFKSLVKNLALTLNVQFSFICQIHNRKKAAVIAAWDGDHHIEPFEYGLENTPCEGLLQNEIIYHPADLASIFPEDQFLIDNNMDSYLAIQITDAKGKIFGHMGVMHKRPLPDKPHFVTTLKFFAERAVAEIQRKQMEEELRKNKERYRELADSFPQAIFEINRDGNLTFYNNYTLESFGLNKEDILNGISIFQMIVPEEIDLINEAILKIFDGEKLGFSEFTAVKKDGTIFPVMIYTNPILNNNIITGIRLMLIDITDLKHAREALQESEEKYSLAIQGAKDGFWDWNLKSNKIHFSSRWKKMLGHQENDIKENIEEWFSRVHANDIKLLKEKLFSYIDGISDNFEVEYRILHKNGLYHWMLCRGVALRDNNANAYRMAGSQTDISEYKASEQMLEQLLHESSHDTLTALPNRALFIDRLERAISLMRSKKDFLFSVLCLDIDRFKIINDSLGHSIGDLLIISAAEKIKSCLRPDDTIARLGGDEFAVLLENIKDSGETQEIAKKIQTALKIPFVINSHEVFASVSIGIATSSTNYEQAEEILRDADLALYRAKSMGKSRYEIFDTNMHTHAMQILNLENDLRKALERNEFLIHYQPIVSLGSGKITGFEALIRWKHPERGLVSSDEFIPLAEETGLIIPIGKWVITEACNQISRWKKLFPHNDKLTVSVNISGKQFTHSGLLEHIVQTLADTELEATSLKLEITESVIMENTDVAKTMLFKLNDLNIQLQIDDFGTGYSSLSYLHRFPVSALKIDRSFVSRIGNNGDNSEIVRTILLLAHNLGMNVIAEGIETQEQLLHLRELNCEKGQGYYFSRPVDKETAEKLIMNDPEW